MAALLIAVRHHRSKRFERAPMGEHDSTLTLSCAKVQLSLLQATFRWPQTGKKQMVHFVRGSRAVALGIVLTSLFVSAASAQLLQHKDLSAAIAMTIAQTAIETCKTNGY